MAHSGKPSRAWYASSIEAFRATAADEILGTLAKNSSFAMLETQRDAWVAQIGFLRERLRGLTGSLFFEFSIPRMGRRVDIVLLTGGVVFVVEFKVGATAFDVSAIDQVWDYAVDLKNFHEASHRLTIVPLLVATDARHLPVLKLTQDSDGVVRPLAANRASFRDVIDFVSSRFTAQPIDAERGAAASYRPTPTIIEAARALYAQHSVEAIARHDAGAETLRVTSRHLEDLVAEAKRTKQKLICFVTGVPEDAATEFQVQGLELDWTCVTWDADLRLRDGGWSFHDFRGSRWMNVNSIDNRRYLLNSYRVLLTRARQGMVIFIPPGNRNDPTRSPEYYDATFAYLAELGVRIVG